MTGQVVPSMLLEIEQMPQGGLSEIGLNSVLADLDTRICSELQRHHGFGQVARV